MDVQACFEQYMAALRAGDRRQALGEARAGLHAGLDIRDMYLDVFQPAMHEVGRLWETNEFTVAQEHLATAITQSVMAQLFAEIDDRPYLGRSMVATCIGGELHELGMRMIADFFELEGWDVYFLGANMPADDVVRMVIERRAELLAISVTLSSHILQARQLVAAVRAAPEARNVRIMVGGQPFNRAPELFQTLGADFTARNAREAVQRAMEALA